MSDIQIQLTIHGLAYYPEILQHYENHEKEWHIAIEHFITKHFTKYAPNGIKLSSDQVLTDFILDIEKTGGEQLKWYGQSLSDYFELKALSSGQYSNHSNISLSITYNDNQIELPSLLLTLSCLLQYSNELYGAYSPHSLFGLRKFVINEVMAQLMDESQLFVEFDRGQVENCLEEWLISPLTSDRHHLQAWNGRSSGLLLTGPKGIGKTFFCEYMLQTFIKTAPWLFTVISPSTENSQIYFDASQFIDPNFHLFQDSPSPTFEYFKVPSLTSLDPEQPESEDGGDLEYIKRLQTFFKQIAKAKKSANGKIVICCIKDLDLILTADASGGMFTYFQSQISQLSTSPKQESEFFLLATTSDSISIPAFDSTNSSKNYYLALRQFRTLKLYPVSLWKAFTYLLELVSQLKINCFGLEAETGQWLRSCVERIRFPTASTDQTVNSERILDWRKKMSLRMHNLNVYDLHKLSLHLQLGLFKFYQSKEQEEPTLKDFMNVFEKKLYDSHLLSSMNPAFVSSLKWTLPHVKNPILEKLCQDIYENATHNSQILFFIKINPNPKPNEISISQIPAFLSHLHQIFAFRNSFFLTRPEQLLPHHPKLSANMPQSIANPFESFFGEHYGSILIVDDLERLTGYHEELKHYKEKNMVEEVMNDQSVSRSASIHYSVGAGLGGHIGFATNTSDGNTNTESMVTGTKKGVSGEARFGLTPPKGVVGLVHEWDNERAIGNQISQSTGESKSYSPHVHLHGHVSHSRTSGNGKGIEKLILEEEIKGSGYSRIWEYPEAMTRLVVGLNDISEIRLESLNNICLVFYSKDGAYQEISEKRLIKTPVRIGCRHYKRYLKIYCEHCQLYYDCHLCHNQQHQDHYLDMFQVRRIQCLHCFHKQDLQGQFCQNLNCGRALSTLCCVRCRLFREWIPGGIFHCEGCQVCFPNSFKKYHEQVCGHYKE